ncbi:MAG: pyridoxal phosphate-dependent aminotransferase [Pseudomonadota bacterium]
MDLTERIKKVGPSPTLALDAKTKALQASGVDVVNFAAGEPDFNTPEHIKEAAIRAVKENFTRYTAAGGIQELKEAVCAKFRRDNGLDYTPEEVVISCGGKHTLYNLAQVLFSQGDQVVVPAPYWVSYPPIITLAGAEPVILPATQESGFKISPQDLDGAITPRTKAVIINSPSNPTGAVYTRKDLEGLAEVVLRHNLLVISDDIYEKIIFDGLEFCNLANLGPELKRRTIIAHGVAKTYAMTGWRIGFLAAPKEVASAVTKLQSQSTSNPCSIAQKAALAALTGPEDSIREMVAAFDERRRYLVAELNRMAGITCFKPGGAFYVFPDFSSYYGKQHAQSRLRGSDDLAAYLLEEGRTAVVPGSGFGEEACLRFSYAASMENIQRGLSRIAEALNKLA